MPKRSALAAPLGAVAVLLLLLVIPASASEVLIYFQNPDFNGGFATQNDTSGLGNFATTYDNFTLATAASINRVEWVGSYISGGGSVAGFTVDFWSNSGNAPNALLASFSFAGPAGESSLGNDNAGNPTYLYGSNLSSAFAAVAGTEYWLSIVPDLALPTQWVWETSSDADLNAYQCIFGTCGNISPDLSFALYEPQTTTVPEPGSLILLGTGIVGLAGSLRRKLGA